MPAEAETARLFGSTVSVGPPLILVAFFVTEEVVTGTSHRNQGGGESQDVVWESSESLLDRGLDTTGESVGVLLRDALGSVVSSASVCVSAFVGLITESCLTLSVFVSTSALHDDLPMP